MNKKYDMRKGSGVSNEKRVSAEQTVSDLLTKQGVKEMTKGS